jgi:glycosyltransferase involved in cell wall biosynthesis
MRRALRPLLSLLTPWTRRISAMVRVKNEEEFLYPSITSIVDSVDEVVIVDNLSDDQTPSIIRYLVQEHPRKIRAYTYPHRVARPGPENIALAATPEGRKSPELLANFYNWCLRRCTQPYALKWDGDMVAGPEFSRAVETFRQRTDQVMCVSGANVHDSLNRYVMRVDGYSPIEHYEPRLFLRRFARYADYGSAIETLYTPYRGSEWTSVYEPLTYVHLKYCKQDPLANTSFAAQPLPRPGRLLEDELAETVRSAIATSRSWSDHGERS